MEERMSVKTVVVCDECGREKGEADQWILFNIVEAAAGPAPVETQATRCSKCGGSTFSTQWGLCTCSLAQPSESELPPIPKPLTKSKHWDDGIEWRIAGERAARLEREDQLRAALATVARLEHEVARLKGGKS